MYTGLQVQYPLILSDFNETCICSTGLSPRSPASLAGQYMRVFWWKIWHWGKFSSKCFGFSPVSIIPPTFLTRHQPHAALTRRTSGAKPGHLFGNQLALDRKLLSYCFHTRSNCWKKASISSAMSVLTYQRGPQDLREIRYWGGFHETLSRDSKIRLT